MLIIGSFRPTVKWESRVCEWFPSLASLNLLHVDHRFSEDHMLLLKVSLDTIYRHSIHYFRVSLQELTIFSQPTVYMMGR